jgi:hypothetical protein
VCKDTSRGDRGLSQRRAAPMKLLRRLEAGAPIMRG